MHEDDTELIQDLVAHFLVPPSEHVFREFDKTAASLRLEYESIAKGFRHSLASTLSTVAMPFSLASASVEHNHFQRIHIAERIRARAYGDFQEGAALEVIRDRMAKEKADVRMREFIQSQEGQNAIIEGTCKFLLASLKNGLEPCAQELLHQGLVLLWSAFEVLCRDTFEAQLNLEPTKIQPLMNDPSTRKRFDAERLPLDTLLQHGFDLSARLGTVLVAKQDFSDLPTVKAVYSVLYSANADLLHALAHRDLWTLYQRRHLVVHRRGVIDQPYLDATGEARILGSRLAVTPKDFETALGVVVAAGAALMQSFSTTSKN